MSREFRAIESVRGRFGVVDFKELCDEDIQKYADIFAKIEKMSSVDYDQAILLLLFSQQIFSQLPKLLRNAATPKGICKNCSRLEKKIADLKFKLEQVTGEYDSKRKECDHLKAEVARLEAELKHIRLSFSKIIDALENERDQLISELEKKQFEIKALENKRNELILKLKATEEEASKKQLELESIIEEQEEKIASLEEQVQWLQEPHVVTAHCSIRIPEGVYHRQIFYVTIGDQTIPLTVPDNKMPGDVIEFDIPGTEAPPPDPVVKSTASQTEISLLDLQEAEERVRMLEEEFNQRLCEKDNTIGRLHQDLEAHQMTIAERDERITELENLLKLKDEKIEELQKLIEQKESEIQKLIQDNMKFRDDLSSILGPGGYPLSADFNSPRQPADFNSPRQPNSGNENESTYSYARRKLSEVDEFGFPKLILLCHKEALRIQRVWHGFRGRKIFHQMCKAIIS